MSVDERRSRRPARWGVAAGLTLILLAPLVWWMLQPGAAGQQVTTVNAAAAAELVGSNEAPPPIGSTPVPSTPVPSSPTAPAATAPTAEPAPPTSEASPPTPPTSEPAAPAPPPAPPDPVSLADPGSLSLPTLGVDAPVVPVGTTDDGQMQVPRDVRTVGWYRFGPPPGAPNGSAVLTGHVDDIDQGAGAFARIGDLQPGDPLAVVDTDGRTLSYTVLAREQWPKSQVPLDRLFDRSGEPRLVLITCGGAFDDSVLGYDDNIAITAVRSG